MAHQTTATPVTSPASSPVAIPSTAATGVPDVVTSSSGATAPATIQTPTMDRGTVLTLWQDAWAKGLGFAPWKDVLQGLTAGQAAWPPGDGRHSIWAHVSHMCFWREYIAAAARKLPVPSDEEIRRRNFECPPSSLQAVQADWEALRERFVRSYRAVADVYADPVAHHEWMWGLIAHDSYHVGQVMLVRALQGLPPLM
jgi:DinB superfamily